MTEYTQEQARAMHDVLEQVQATLSDIDCNNDHPSVIAFNLGLADGLIRSLRYSGMANFATPREGEGE